MPAAAPTTRLALRVLATTDIHGNLLAHDYFANRRVSDFCLEQLAPLIDRARAQNRNCLLFDTGDYLQGTPLSDLMAQSPPDAPEPHPAILAMNTLGYDAAGLGNHEFNFGLDRLTEILTRAEFPVTCANLLRPDGTALFSPFLLLERDFEDDTGIAHRIRIGIIGLIPPQTTVWDRVHLHGRAVTRDIVETARQHVPLMRVAGADVVIVLAHTGIARGPYRPMMENAALPLGAVPGIDALIAGHTHQVFPSAQFRDYPGADPDTGRLHGTPAVMAGAHGSHLGVVDLDLRRSPEGRWRVGGASARALALDPSGPVPRHLRKALRPAHDRTLKLIRQPIGKTTRALHSYLALVSPCAATAVVTRAQAEAARTLLRGSMDEGLPVLSASAPFKTGGRGGPAHFTDVPPGTLRLHHAADLYPFPNVPHLIRITGRDLHDWLERAAILFHRIVPGKGGQALIDPAIPGHTFDMIDGLSYEIDLGQPPRHDISGRVINPSSRRIRKLRHQGREITEDQEFVLATNNYRVSGSGPFAAIRPEQVIHADTRQLREVVADYIRVGHDPSEGPPQGPWRFCPMPGTEVVFDTGAGLRRYPEEIMRIGALDLGDTQEGFARLAMPL